MKIVWIIEASLERYLQKTYYRVKKMIGLGTIINYHVIRSL